MRPSRAAWANASLILRMGYTASTLHRKRAFCELRRQCAEQRRDALGRRLHEPALQPEAAQAHVAKHGVARIDDARLAAQQAVVHDRATIVHTARQALRGAAADGIRCDGSAPWPIAARTRWSIRPVDRTSSAPKARSGARRARPGAPRVHGLHARLARHDDQAMPNARVGGVLDYPLPWARSDEVVQHQIGAGWISAQHRELPRIHCLRRRRPALAPPLKTLAPVAGPGSSTRSVDLHVAHACACAATRPTPSRPGVIGSLGCAAP